MIAYSKEELLILGGFSTGETKADNKYERAIYKLKCSSGTVYRLGHLAVSASCLHLVPA